MLPDSGERALRVLKQDMPWLANRELPRMDTSAFMVAMNDDEAVVLVTDEANGEQRDFVVHPSIANQPGRVRLGAIMALSAPWN